MKGLCMLEGPWGLCLTQCVWGGGHGSLQFPFCGSMFATDPSGQPAGYRAGHESVKASGLARKCLHCWHHIPPSVPTGIPLQMIPWEAAHQPQAGVVCQGPLHSLRKAVSKQALPHHPL